MERLTSLFLSIPELLITRRHYRFSDPPLRWLDTVITAFYPFAIGLIFLMPIDLIFSTLVFYALYHGQDVLGRAVRWHHLTEFPYRNQQSVGGFVGLLCCLLWVGRAHLT